VTGERVERRLAAVLAADVAGYSRLMGADEVGTLKALKAHRSELIDPSIAEYKGRIVKTTGDGMLIEFASAVDAVTCAVAVQNMMGKRNADAARKITFRIGINVGDIIIDGDDIYGDGVNIAARVENECEPGGVCLSGSAFEQVRGKTSLIFDDLGEKSLKNIDRPVRLYAVNPAAPAAETSLGASPAELLTVPDKLSIAVLPFQNMSGDPEQEFFADGIAEDVLTTLSKIQELFVIARNSSFVFKSQAKDVREIGRILGVRYVLEGSVRKIGNRVRLTAQLIDSLDGHHLWADHFDGDLNDVFELQDRITQDIVAALEVRLTLGEQARVWRKRSGSPFVYEHFLKGRSLYVNFARHTHAQARSFLERALEINPDFTPVLVQLGWTLTDQARFGWEQDRAATYEAALKCAARALAADPGCGEAYTVIGYVRMYQRRHEEALEAGEKAVALCPSGTDAYHMTGMSHGYAGDFERAVLYEEQAQRLSPIELNVSMVDEARARFHLNDFKTARDIAQRVLMAKPRWLTAQSTLIASLWNLGEYDDARAIARNILAGHPHFSVTRWGRGLPYRYDKHLDALLEPLRLAGLPD
jgi:adenylate cyclase